MEMEFFCSPDSAETWFEYWTQQRLNWWKSLGVRDENLILRKHGDDELAHYSKDGLGTYDIEYAYPSLMATWRARGHQAPRQL